jgi:hypothetical protein
MITTQAEQRGRRCEDPQDTKPAHGVQDLHVQCICAVQLHPASTFPPHTLPVPKGTPRGPIFRFSDEVMCGYGLFTPGAQGTSPLWRYFCFLMFL